MKTFLETMSFPRYETPTGRIIGGPYLGKSEICESWFDDPDKLDPKIASLYYAGDRTAAVQEINEIINFGTHLILDRYVESNMGHQGGKAKTLREKKEIIKFIHGLEYKLLNLPKPNEVIFLHMPTSVAIELRKRRNKKADGHESNIGHLHRTEGTYLQLARLYHWKKLECAPDETINSLRTPEDIHEELYKHIRKILNIK